MYVFLDMDSMQESAIVVAKVLIQKINKLLNTEGEHKDISRLPPRLLTNCLSATFHREKAQQFC